MVRTLGRAQERLTSSHGLLIALYLAAPSVALAQDAAPPLRVLSLQQALQSARKHQPSLRKAAANIDVAEARVDQARAPRLPQVTATAAYQLASANTPRRAGSFSDLLPPDDPSFKPYSYFNFGLNANQLIYDFGQLGGRQDAAQANASAERQSERATRLQVEANVRAAYFEARAAKAMAVVARETLANHEQHLAQIEAFVRAGTRAEIDLAQVRTSRASAVVDVIRAENAYLSAKARLNQAMGGMQGTDYEVADDSMPAIPGEDGVLAALLDRALKKRPEFAALQSRVRALEHSRGAIEGAYWPTLSASTGVTEAGSDLGEMAWNWNAGVTLTWPLFQGGITDAQSAEASASLVGLRADVDQLAQQVRFEIEQARLSVRAAKAALVASEEAVSAARERLRLAEGRYQTGVGSGLELEDAQLALSSARAQQVQAEYSLAAARAGLLGALGE